jgi:glycosyltransferase involved in cell wall biosynthesis
VDTASIQQNHAGAAVVLFVAGFSDAAGGATGGQVTAARTLLHSGLSKEYTLVPLCSTPPRLPPPSLPARAWLAARRAGRFVGLLRSCDVVLVFSSDGWSIAEKGLLCLLARLAGRGVLLRISGGNIAIQAEAHALLRVWLRIVLKATNRLCTQGSYWSEYFRRRFSAKVIEIPNGIALPDPGPEPRPASTFGRILFVGSIQEGKGVFELLDVLALLVPEHPGLTMTAIGGGIDEDRLRERASELGLRDNLEMTGWVSRQEVAAFYRQADVFLFPSHSEGLPNAVLEAMSHSLPVVVTAVGAMPDVIAHGDSGFLTEVGNVHAMAGHIRHLLRDRELADRVGRQGRMVVERNFDIEIIWRRWSAAIREVILQ